MNRFFKPIPIATVLLIGGCFAASTFMLTQHQVSKASLQTLKTQIESTKIKSSGCGCGCGIGYIQQLQTKESISTSIATDAFSKIEKSCQCQCRGIQK